MTSPFTKFPSVLRASAGITMITSGPFFLYLLSVALERRPDEAKDIVGRWRAVAAVSGPLTSSSSSTPTSWRLRFNSMNMASIESPDGLAIRGRALYHKDKGGLTILPIWGETGRYFGFGFRPVRVQVAQWPRRTVSSSGGSGGSGGGGGGGETDAEAIEKDLFVVSSISTVYEEDTETKTSASTANSFGENDLKETCGIVAFMRE